MRGIWPGLTRLVLDTVVPLPVGYYVLLHDDCLQLLRVRPSSSRLLYEESYRNNSLAAIDEFLRWYASHIFSVQPVAVLVNCQCFTSVRRTDRLSADQALKAIRATKTLQTDTAEVRFASVKARKASWLVVQGINRQFQQSLRERLEQAGVSVLFIQTLVSYLVAATSLLSDQPGIASCQWSAGKTTFLGINQRGEVWDMQLPYGQAPGPSCVEDMEALYFLKTTNTSATSVDSSAPPRTGSPAKLLPSRPVFDRRYRPLQTTITTSGSAKASLVGISSLKLFNLIAIIALLLSLMVCGGFSLARSANPAEVAAFQHLYSRRLDLERQLESLERARDLIQQGGGSSEAAVLFAAFCQTPVTDVRLASISWRQDKDSVLCEVAGRADGDMAVFGYMDDLKPLVRPWVVQLASLRQEIMTLQGRQDTGLAFKLTIRKELLSAQK